MKYIILLCFAFISLQTIAQIGDQKKQPTFGFHVFYNDFNTAQLIRTTSLQSVINSGGWSKLSTMQMGLGFNYLQGLTKKIDLEGTINGSYIDYLFRSGLTNGSSKFLLTTQATANLKMFTDAKTVVPYINTGAGFSLYNGKAGLYIPAGLGLQFNIFNEAFVYTNAQYRIALSNDVNYHFNYNIGIAYTLAKPTKKPKLVVMEPVKVPAAVAAKITLKNMVVSVVDEATGQPLPDVEVSLIDTNGKKLSAATDVNGRAIFSEMPASDYTITGRLNNINTTAKNINADSFTGAENDLNVKLTHNDPRFTLSGVVVNKATNLPEAGVGVTVTNETQSSINTQLSKMGTGTFSMQLEANSDFTIVGKKASYLSNIEKATTKGLNRSATLYLKLELAVQEVTAVKNIVLNNINFATGKSILDTKNSSDLNKLIQFLNDNPASKLEIQGHTDNVGNVAGNNLLSQKRANSIVDYLIKEGINKSRLMAKGYGSAQPIGDNKTIEGKAQNRRVEMKLVK